MSHGADFLGLTPAEAPTRGRSVWLAYHLRAAIAAGRLARGAALPATRALATELGWSRGVVVQAYELLAEQGVVTADGRRGTHVAHTAVPAAAPPAITADDRAAAAAIDLSPGVPDSSLFPRALWLRTERAILADQPAALRYADPSGSAELRRAVASWLGVHRGMDVRPEEVMIVAGVAQALALVATVLTRRGHSMIAVEDPGSAGAKDAVAYWGLEPIAVPVDDEGIVVTQLAETPARAAMVTPAHQFPTGVALSASRRGELVRWAQERQGYVIEDDYDAEQRYDRRPVAAARSLAPERIIHTGSVSKTLAPALRLGWLVAPLDLRGELREAKYASDIANPTLPQLVLAHLITSGAYDAHIRRVRQHQRTRRNVFLELMRTHLPQAEITGIAAGLHVLATFPSLDFDDLQVAASLALDGVLIDPLARHRSTPGAPGFVLGYAANSPSRLATALEIVARAVTT